MSKSDEQALTKESAKLHAFAGQNTTRRFSLKYNLATSVQKLSLLLQQTPPKVTSLNELWDSCLLIFPTIETDINFLNFFYLIVSHPKYISALSLENSLYLTYRTKLIKTLELVISAISTFSLKIDLPSASIRGTAGKLHAEFDERTCSFETARPVLSAPKKKSLFSKFKRTKTVPVMTVTEELIPFAVKIIGLGYFRVPIFRECLLLDFETHIQYKSTWTMKKALSKHFPSLMMWDDFDSKLKKAELDVNIKVLNNEKSLFVMIFHEIVVYLEKQTINKVIQWTIFHGFDVLLEMYTREYKDLNIADDYVHALDGILVSSVHPKMINFYMETELSRTNMYDEGAVLSTIADLEFYFSKLRTKVLLLKKDFDVELLCKFIDTIIESENVVTLQRILTVLYSYADLFSGKVRHTFFIEYLLDKKFFVLAYFWEENVISLFVQLLLFKGTIAKVKNIESGVLEDVEKKLYDLQEPFENITPAQLDLNINKKVRRKFEKTKVEKLSRKQRPYYESCGRIYGYFTDMYNEWQVSGSDVFPNLIFMHSVKEKDEITLALEN
ncbi:hypothetical protein EIN_275030 [Entamoeba invadens IP1]|uniref:Uncharacterized protein n=1 Tax=Entamoeba invadens IP1 TaxID=370355 RepID=A0A0A1U7F9_ENTIV|nr:hypothetical protein EIN_275030 [Entamoeba invadens IP1]ELP87916.1 hypothetical protein EIN_275030 [Entamoeba invadens IP1]|eukprot:XP_004254687.1 hypothetical protein EIN_275030 [Entamoeba invadens IP1]